MRLKLAALCAVFCTAALLPAQERQIDTDRSTITVHVGKAGLLAMAAHEHWVNAPIASGVIDETAGRVEFRVETASMKVKPDPKISATTQQTIQEHMDDMTLETAKYPEISFRSTGVKKQGEGQFKVDGTLTLHGVSKPVSLNVKRAGDSWTGHTVIKQTDFGIKPISVGGGSIKIKDPVDIDFAIFARP